jgi:hypothetical protein
MRKIILTLLVTLILPTSFVFASCGKKAPVIPPVPESWFGEYLFNGFVFCDTLFRENDFDAFWDDENNGENAKIILAYREGVARNAFNNKYGTLFDPNVIIGYDEDGDPIYEGEEDEDWEMQQSYWVYPEGIDFDAFCDAIEDMYNTVIFDPIGWRYEDKYEHVHSFNEYADYKTFVNPGEFLDDNPKTTGSYTINETTKEIRTLVNGVQVIFGTVNQIETITNTPFEIIGAGGFGIEFNAENFPITLQFVKRYISQ